MPAVIVSISVLEARVEQVLLTGEGQGIFL